jgi:hypothetical protein
MRWSRLGILAAALLLFGQSFPSAVGAAGNIPSTAVGVLVTIAPPELPADGGSYAAVFVSLIDTAGLPTMSLNSTTVFLTSSQTNIGSVPDSIVIQAGSEYAVATVTTTSTPGSATITAHSEGLHSSQAQLQTVTPGGFPSKLRVVDSPARFLPRSDRGQVWVELLDDAGNPAKAISDVPISLTSSNSSIASLTQNSLTIATGSLLSDVGSFSTSGSGIAVITATSTSYSSGSALVTVDPTSICIGQCGASELLLKLLPEVLPTDGLSYAVLEVSLATQSGSPAVSSSDVQVLLTSDKPSVASVPGDNSQFVTIPAGSISVLANVKTSALAANANITGTAPTGNLVPGHVSVQTMIPAPSKLQAYVAPPSTAFSTNGNDPILVVQLWGSDNPARARQDTNVVITSSNKSLISNYISLTIPKGKDYVTTPLLLKGVGTSILTATSQGLESAHANVVVVPSPLVVTLTPLSPYIYSNQTDFFTFNAVFVGTPLQNLNVTWAASAGTFAPPVSATGSGGSASTNFTPNGAGSINVTAIANSPVTGPIVASYSLQVLQAPVKPSPTLIQQIIGYWYYIAAAVAVAVAAGYYLFRLRRKKQRSEIEAGFEAV